MKRLAISLATLSILASGVVSAAADTPVGTWLRDDGESKIEIKQCGSTLCGDIVWLKTPRKDANNRDKSKRDRDLVGVQVVNSLKAAGDKVWNGEVYNPRDGKTYSGKVTILENGHMKMEGCALGGLVCRGASWAPSS